MKLTLFFLSQSSAHEKKKEKKKLQHIISQWHEYRTGQRQKRHFIDKYVVFRAQGPAKHQGGCVRYTDEIGFLIAFKHISCDSQ